jgi:hypothetical protein
MYTPCVDCSGTGTITILLIENQTASEIPQASSEVNLKINVQPINDLPVIFVTLNASSILNKDPTEDVVVCNYILRYYLNYIIKRLSQTPDF